MKRRAHPEVGVAHPTGRFNPTRSLNDGGDFPGPHPLDQRRLLRGRQALGPPLPTPAPVAQHLTQPAPNDAWRANRGGEPNELTFLVNGAEVASLTDGALAEGGVSLFVGGDGNDVAVRRLAVQALE